MNTDTTTYEDLKTQFGDILSSTINIEPDPDPTFLNISGFPHYEEVISNWYAFFFNTEQPHGLGSLFIDSLVERINASGKLPEISSFDRCQVVREHSVNGKSIDLLLYDESLSEKNEQGFRNAIVVENKIYASLYNDLDLYIKNVAAEQSKAGVLLSLQSHSEIPSNYINILHKDFMEQVLANLGKYLFRASSKYLLFLKDFVQQIQTISKTESMKQYINFYFEHAEKINQLNGIRGKALDALLQEVHIALASTPFMWGRRYPESLNIRYEHDRNVLLILKLENIFDKAKYVLELWFSPKLPPRWKDQELRNVLKREILRPNGFSFRSDRAGKNDWIGSQEVSFERSLSEINNFPVRFAEDLKNNWHPFLQSIISRLK